MYQGKERNSVVHFTASGLFWYIDNDCKTDKVFMEEDYKQMSDEQRVKWHEKRRNRWENILSMMTKWDPQ